jgi:hypothetical protein
VLPALLPRATQSSNPAGRGRRSLAIRKERTRAMIIDHENNKYDLRREFNKGYQKGVNETLAKVLKLVEQSKDPELAKKIAELSFE